MKRHLMSFYTEIRINGREHLAQIPVAMYLPIPQRFDDLPDVTVATRDWQSVLRPSISPCVLPVR